MVPKSVRRRRTQLTPEELFEAYGLDPTLVNDVNYVTARNDAAIDLARRLVLLEANNRGLFAPHRAAILLGGTVLRVTRFGPFGRISFDIDLNLPADRRDWFWSTLDGQTAGPFKIRAQRTPRRRGRRPRADRLIVESELFVDGGASIKVDLVGYPRVTAPEESRFVNMPLDELYPQPDGQWLRRLSLIENIAGKLCRYYNTPNLKDLHDCHFAAPHL